MYIDKNLLFADKITTTVSAASTSYLDSTVVSIKNNDAYGHPMFWVVKTEATAFAVGAGTPTATFQLQTSEDANFLDSTTITLAQSAALQAASLTADKVVVRMRVPLGLKRYTRVYNSVNNNGDTTKFSAASWSSFFTPDVDSNLP